MHGFYRSIGEVLTGECVGAWVLQEYWGSIDWRVWVHWLYRSIGEVLTGECGCIGSTGVLGKY